MKHFKIGFVLFFSVLMTGCIAYTDGYYGSGVYVRETVTVRNGPVYYEVRHGPAPRYVPTLEEARSGQCRPGYMLMSQSGLCEHERIYYGDVLSPRFRDCYRYYDPRYAGNYRYRCR